MNPQSTPFRIFALGFALVLVAGLVYIRSGGNLWADIGRATTPPDDVQRLEAKVDQLERKFDALLATQGVPATEPVMPVSAESTSPPAEFLPGPKSAPVVLFNGNQPLTWDAPPTEPTTVELLPGSKSDDVLSPQQLQAILESSQSAPQPNTPTTPSVLPATLPGSKSAGIVLPSDLTPPQSSAGKPSAAPESATTVPRTALPGSKSAAVVVPSDVTAPNSPPAIRPVQPAPDRRSSTYQGANNGPAPAPKLLPGSKSPGVLISPADLQPMPVPAKQSPASAKPKAKSRAMLPGSKSRMVLDPADFQQVAPQQQQARPPQGNQGDRP
jgi:hypothetical protein